jgi:hypothetical protein
MIGWNDRLACLSHAMPYPGFMMPDTGELRRQIEEQTRRVQGLQVAVFSQADPAGNEPLFEQLAKAEGHLAELQQQLQKQSPAIVATSAEVDKAPESAPQSGRFLGQKSTGLEARARIQIDPLPTGAYHLLDPGTDPLLIVDVENFSRDTRRVCVKAHLEGLSATAVRTIEIEARQTKSFKLQPTLFPERAQAITEVQRATLHIVVEDLDGKLESHNTYPITCLARTSSFNAVRRPETGETVDLSHYYGAWVTPHVDAVQERIRRAVELAPDRQMLGYQGDPDLVQGQVAALYQSLRETEIVYVNSVIDYGAAVGMTTQRTRLPRETIALRSANCIDGTVLLASLIEGVSLNPAIVLVPGHAFVGWETWHGSGEWRFLETTLMGTADFEIANKSGQRQFDQFSKFSRDKIKLHSVQDLRARGIWPME